MLIHLDFKTHCANCEACKTFYKLLIRRLRGKQYTGIRMSWLYDTSEVSDAVKEPDIQTMNFETPEGAIGIVVHSSTFHAAVACWYGPSHDMECNIYVDQAPGTQQTYFLAGTFKNCWYFLHIVYILF